MRRHQPSRAGTLRRLAIPGLTPRTSFQDVVAERTSTRVMSSPDIGEIGALLWHAARIQEGTREGVQHRLAASSGGLHPIDILLLRRRRLYWYDGLQHGLLRVKTSRDVVDATYSEARRLLPDARGDFLVLAGHLEVTAAKYEHPHSLLWRDAGCVLQGIYLTGAWLRLAVCALGILGDQLVAEAYGSPAVLGVGVCAVGRVVDQSQNGGAT